MPLLDLLYVASVPILKVLILTALGSFLALDNIHVLGESTRKELNRVVFLVFNPALVVSSLAKTITHESIVTLWFMPVNILCVFIVGSALGWILIKITRPAKQLKGLILGCCAAGNNGSLPFIIIPAVCREKGSPFGSPDVCSTYGMAYVSLSMAVSAIYMWSYVYNIVRISSRDVTKEAGNDGHGGSSSAVKDASEKPELIQGNYSEAFRASKEFPVHLSDKIKQCIGMISRKLNLKAVLAPSTTAAIVGFIIGVVPQIRNSLIGASAPLHVVADSASLIGDASIPTVTLIVGGNLLRGLRGSGIQSSLIVGILAVRFVFLPLIGTAYVKGAVHFGLVHSDPLYQFVLLLHFAVPPALNIGTITQLFGAGESECSVIMLWAYAKVYCEFQILNPNVHFIKAFGLRIILENGLDVDAALSNVIGPRVKFFDVNGRKVPGWTSISFCGDLRSVEILLVSNQCVVSNIAPPKLGRYPEFVQVAVVPVLKVLLITLVGLFLALDRIDLLGSTARPYLNNLLFYVFSPALVSSQLAGTITLQSLATLWFMPVNILLTFIIGSALAWILIKITRTPPHLQGLVIGCCSAGNLGNLLLIIVPAVCSESNSPFGDSTVCASYGMAYASLSMAVGAIFIWTYVFIIMRIYADNSAGNIENVSTADSESYTEALLPSSEKSSCHDHSAHGELPETLSDGKKVTFMERTFGRFKKFAAKHQPQEGVCTSYNCCDLWVYHWDSLSNPKADDW
ncbi:hypothetical protein OIU79_026275 [Salix purpurea]|uniref:Uncharacterized protein n=1 Tax=Salix purpurea TaxID=77065 RepID=A0A9Q0VRG0_SALPP|nr:hypothetical protein OIU79_026275 [Salix purpurea]